jgi:death-on-curing protein
MTEPRWLNSQEVRAAYERQIVRFGGPPGLRDENALESALGRPINRWR